VEFDQDASCSRKCYTLAQVPDGSTLNDAEQALGRGWPAGANCIEVWTLGSYDETNVAALISLVEAAVPGTYTIYEVFSLGVTSSRAGTATDASPWWISIYQDLHQDRYWPDTESYAGETLLELQTRGMIS
jgi:hypothetical protein